MKTFIAKKLFKKQLHDAYKLGVSQGRYEGIKEEREFVLERLSHHSVKPFNNDELTLGYEQAIAAVKGILVRR